MTNTPTISPQDEDWRRFRSTPFMVNHWDRPGWTSDRKAYYWYLTFYFAQLRAMAESCQEHLRLPYLDMVPSSDLHLTMVKAGWVDEISLDHAESIAHAALEACSDLHPFKLSIGPLSGSPGAVRFSVGPWEPLLELHYRLRNAVATVRGNPCRDGEFRPHVGVAYCNTSVPSGPLVSIVSQLRDLPPVTTLVERVDLVILGREGRKYVWTPFRSVQL